MILETNLIQVDEYSMSMDPEIAIAWILKNINHMDSE